MSRFNPLYLNYVEENIHQLVRLVAQARRKDARDNFVVAYREGVYRIYENLKNKPKDQPAVEVNPAARMSYEEEVWLFETPTEVMAFVEFQPDYREPIVVADLNKPVLQVTAARRPEIMGFK